LPHRRTCARSLREA